MYELVCRRCPGRIDESECRAVCPSCQGPLHFRYSGVAAPTRERSMWRFRSRLPVGETSEVVTLGEGGTPLLPVMSVRSAEVYLKNETVNPTGSHKDRALSVAVTRARDFGHRAVMLYSDGSTALSSAAYAARAGLRSVTVVGRGLPEARLRPLAAYGSSVLEYQGTAAEALDWAHEACRTLGIFETSTYRRANPYQAEGPKTIGLEIADALDGPPDWIVVPVGGGGTLAGIARAFEGRRPRLAGVLPAGYDLLPRALRLGTASEDELRALAPREGPPTLQAKIAMACPPDGLEAVAAVRDTGGVFLHATDEEVAAAMGTLAAREGVYAEPSAAAAWVGVEKLMAAGSVGRGMRVVAVITGSGFREAAGPALSKWAVDRGSGLAVLEELLEAPCRA